MLQQKRSKTQHDQVPPELADEDVRMLPMPLPKRVVALA